MPFNRIYRRKIKVFLLIGFLIVTYFFIEQNFNNSNNQSGIGKVFEKFNVKLHDGKQIDLNAANNNELKLDSVEQIGVDKRYKKVRINIKNYIQPPPCISCPGEGGQAVILTVRTNFIFLVDKCF